jgi:hypothetical protein
MKSGRHYKVGVHFEQRSCSSVGKTMVKSVLLTVVTIAALDLLLIIGLLVLWIRGAIGVGFGGVSVPILPVIVVFSVVEFALIAIAARLWQVTA